MHQYLLCSINTHFESYIVHQCITVSSHLQHMYTCTDTHARTHTQLHRELTVYWIMGKLSSRYSYTPHTYNDRVHKICTQATHCYATYVTIILYRNLTMQQNFFAKFWRQKTLANLAKRMSFAIILPSQIPGSLKQVMLTIVNSPTFSSPKFYSTKILCYTV